MMNVTWLMGRVKNGGIRLQTDRQLFILGYMHASESIFTFHFYCLLFILFSLFFFFFLLRCVVRYNAVETACSQRCLTG